MLLLFTGRPDASCVIGPTKHKCGPQPKTRAALGGRADCILLIAPDLDSKLAGDVAACELPSVVLSADAPQGALMVTVDNHAASDQVLTYLLELGHRRIGHIVGRVQMRDGLERRNARGLLARAQAVRAR